MRIENGLKQYPSYKPSGIEWLGDVPAHWRVLPNRVSFTEINEKNHPLEQMLSVTISDGVILQSELLEDTSKKDGSRIDRSSYKLVQPGDIAYNKMRAWQGALGVSAHRGIVSPAYVVQRPRPDYNSRFLHYLLRTPNFAKEAERWSYGITSDMWSLRSEHFRMIYTCVPPLNEQTAIVRYLDHAADRIQRAISAKERLIELLTEQRQAIISHAVTRGLDPNVPLKDSGVEWLGDVPEHWDVRRAKNFYGEVDEGSDTGMEELMSVSHKTGVTPRKSTVTMFMAESNADYKICRQGDIVINTMWAYMAALGIARQVGIVSPSYGVYRPRNDSRLNPDYVDPLLRTETYRAEYLRRSTGITSSRLRLYADEFLGIPLICPPPVEQANIVRHLEKATADIDTAIANAQRQIDLLREYRTRQITDVVTGQVDVRGEVIAR